MTPFLFIKNIQKTRPTLARVFYFSQYSGSATFLLKINTQTTRQSITISLSIIVSDAIIKKQKIA
jgi:hypothetical protein